MQEIILDDERFYVLYSKYLSEVKNNKINNCH